MLHGGQVSECVAFGPQSGADNNALVRQVLGLNWQMSFLQT